MSQWREKVLRRLETLKPFIESSLGVDDLIVETEASVPSKYEAQSTQDYVFCGESCRLSFVDPDQRIPHIRIVSSGDLVIFDELILLKRTVKRVIEENGYVCMFIESRHESYAMDIFPIPTDSYPVEFWKSAFDDLGVDPKLVDGNILLENIPSRSPFFGVSLDPNTSFVVYPYQPKGIILIALEIVKELWRGKTCPKQRCIEDDIRCYLNNQSDTNRRFT